MEIWHLLQISDTRSGLVACQFRHLAMSWLMASPDTWISPYYWFCHLDQHLLLFLSPGHVLMIHSCTWYDVFVLVFTRRHLVLSPGFCSSPRYPTNCHLDMTGWMIHARGDFFWCWSSHTHTTPGFVTWIISSARISTWNCFGHLDMTWWFNNTHDGFCWSSDRRHLGLSSGYII